MVRSIAGTEGSSLTAERELEFILKSIPEKGTLIEVGTFHGASAAWMARKRPDITIISVDPFPGRNENDGDRDMWMRNAKGVPNMKLFVGTLGEFHVHGRDKLLGHRPADVVFIDGDHRYDSVLSDLEEAEKLQPGCIMGHDCARPGVEQPDDVFRAMEAFCGRGAWVCEERVLTTFRLYPAGRFTPQGTPDEDIKGFHGNGGCAIDEADYMVSVTPEKGVFVEVGTYHGVTAAYMAKKRPGATYLSVDPFPSKEGMDLLRNCAGASDYWVANRQPNMRLFIGTLADADTLFRENFADVVFIDGDHLFDAVLLDLRAAWKMVKHRGAILVHDIGRIHREQIERAVEVFLGESGWHKVKQVHSVLHLEGP